MPLLHTAVLALFVFFPQNKSVKRNIVISIALTSLCSIVLSAQVGVDRQKSRENTIRPLNAPSCPSQELKEFRQKTFQSFYKNGAFAEAAQSLERFLEERKCYQNLVMPAQELSESRMTKKMIDDVQSYLWAQSDLLLAWGKSGKGDKCVSLAREIIDSYPHNLIQMAANPKIEKAVKANLAICEKQTKVDVSKDLSPCKFSPQNLDFEIDDLRKEGAVALKLVKGKVIKSFQGASPEDCVALVEVTEQRGFFNACAVDDPDCTDSEKENVQIPFVVGASSNAGKISAKSIFSFEGNSPTSNNLCGDFDLSPVKMKEAKAAFRIRGDWSFCGGGTGNGHLDEVFVYEKGVAKVMSSKSHARH